MPQVPHLQIGNTVYNRWTEQGPKGPPPEELAKAYQLAPSGTGAGGRPQWTMLVPPPVGDKGTQREEMVVRRFEENENGRIAYRTIHHQPGTNRLEAEVWAQLDPRTGSVFLSDDAKGLRPAPARYEHASFRQLDHLKLGVPLRLDAHPTVAAEQNARQAANLIGTEQARLPAAPVPAEQRVSPQQALLQSKLGG